MANSLSELPVHALLACLTSSTSGAFFSSSPSVLSRAIVSLTVLLYVKALPDLMLTLIKIFNFRESLIFLVFQGTQRNVTCCRHSRRRTLPWLCKEGKLMYKSPCGSRRAWQPMPQLMMRKAKQLSGSGKCRTPRLKLTSCACHVHSRSSSAHGLTCFHSVTIVMQGGEFSMSISVVGMHRLPFCHCKSPFLASHTTPTTPTSSPLPLFPAFPTPPRWLSVRVPKLFVVTHHLYIDSICRSGFWQQKKCQIVYVPTIIEHFDIRICLLEVTQAHPPRVTWIP